MGLFKKKEGKTKKGRRKNLTLVLLGVVICYILFVGMNVAVEKTETDEYCQSCHVHTEADAAWKLSTHYDNSSGVIVHCVDCHLPPKGEGHLWWKAYFGAKDVYKFYFTDTDKINWEAKGEVEEANHFTFIESCVKCHSNLFPSTLSDEGGDAHLHYQQNMETITCLNCHITVGHYDENRLHEHNLDFGVIETVSTEIYTEAATVEKFESFTEYIPGTGVSFEMVAIPAGTFRLGSPDDEKYRNTDEGPQVDVQMSEFWMGKTEVSWDEFLAFYAETATTGHASDVKEDDLETDAITGPTAPWGAPDQGWGKGSRPAITMSHYAAEVYCQWLSKVTGKKYRLPTEAEWEYAARGGTTTPYFFEGSPKDYTKQGFKNSILGPKTEIISDYVAYSLNSGAKTFAPEDVQENPYGLLNMSGNVWEFCSDFYAANTYSQYDQGITDPTGPGSGEEHVIRGGAFDSDAVQVRSAARDYTRSVDWLVTDPQIPKSKWWYSDSKNVGFRVVCEPEFNNQEIQ
jgi:formylglycine-generating enzyme required for sulfatase activity/nitrate/TMAO reductase-like tetraheme cytochrome c subunit